MLTLAQASSFFDRTAVFDPTGSTRLFYGQVGNFDDSRRDAGSAYRRILSITPGTTLPNPAAVNIHGQVWLVGSKEIDGLEEMHRDKYVLQACTAEYSLSSLSVYVSGAVSPSTLKRWAGVEWVKDGKEIGSSSDTVRFYTVFLPSGTPVRERQVVVSPLGGEVYLVMSVHTLPSGFVSANTVRLDSTLTTSQITPRAYSAATGAYTLGAAATVACLQVRWQNLFAYDTEAEARYQEGDETLVFPSGTPVNTASLITYAGRTWRAVSVDDLGGAVTVHARPTWAT